MRKSLAQQLESARCELALRQRVYPNWVKARRMTADKAQHEIDCMAAIVCTLENLIADGELPF